jgi:transposase InsO family protein
MRWRAGSNYWKCLCPILLARCPVRKKSVLCRARPSQRWICSWFRPSALACSTLWSLSGRENESLIGQGYSRVRLSGSVASCRMPWSAGCIINMLESEFSVHTGPALSGLGHVSALPCPTHRSHGSVRGSDIGFNLLYVLVIVRVARRELVWINVTSHPTAEWIAQQVTEAFPWNEDLIRDQDRTYGAAVKCRLRAMGIRDKPIAPGSPWQNCFAERLIGSIRRECVDHIVALGEEHLRLLLKSYASYYNTARTHRSLDKVRFSGSVASCRLL